MDQAQRFAFVGVLTAGIAGCTSPAPNLDSRFGEAVTILKARQTLRPEASRNEAPVTGLDGKAAKGALENYRDSFRTPPAEPGNVIQLNLGGAQR